MSVLTVVRDWIYFFGCNVLRRVFASTRKNMRAQKPSPNEKRHRNVCQKEVYRDSKRYIGTPLLVLLCPPVAGFGSMCRKLAEKTPYTFVWQF